MSIPANDPKLQETLRAVPAVAFDGPAFRAIPGGDVVGNLTFEHLWAGTSAGRCNPAGVARLHLSAEKKTAEAEFRYYAQKGGIDPDIAECYSFAANVKLARVLDLTDRKTRRRVNIALKQILAEWEPDPLKAPPPPTLLQCIGYWASRGHGDFSAILCPSARRTSGRKASPSAATVNRQG